MAMPLDKKDNDTQKTCLDKNDFTDTVTFPNSWLKSYEDLKKYAECVRKEFTDAKLPLDGIADRLINALMYPPEFSFDDEKIKAETMFWKAETCKQLSWKVNIFTERDKLKSENEALKNEIELLRIELEKAKDNEYLNILSDTTKRASFLSDAFAYSKDAKLTAENIGKSFSMIAADLEAREQKMKEQKLINELREKIAKDELLIAAFRSSADTKDRTIVEQRKALERCDAYFKLNEKQKAMNKAFFLGVSNIVAEGLEYNSAYTATQSNILTPKESSEISEQKHFEKPVELASHVMPKGTVYPNGSFVIADKHQQ